MTNSPIYLYLKVLILSLVLKNVFSRYKILNWQLFFFFGFGNICITFFLNLYRFWWEICYQLIYFSPINSVLFFWMLSSMFCHVSCSGVLIWYILVTFLLIYLVFGSLSFLNLLVHVLLTNLENLSHQNFEYFYFLFHFSILLWTLITRMLEHLWQSYRFLRLFVFPPVSFLHSGWIISIVLSKSSLILLFSPFFCWSHLLIFLFCLLYFFNFRIFISWFFISDYFV